jgi:glutamate dehydrogenase/leucine dehydrogenase
VDHGHLRHARRAHYRDGRGHGQKPSRWWIGRPARGATGRGVTIVARESAKHVGFDIKGARIGVQGFGNVGSVCRSLAGAGAKIVAVSDWKSGVY